jgi:hypothetical protein
LVNGQIRQVDPARRHVLITVEDGRDLTLALPPDANIEVVEPTTLGTMGGSLEDLKVGYWVRAEFHEPDGEACACTSLVCVS